MVAETRLDQIEHLGHGLVGVEPQRTLAEEPGIGGGLAVVMVEVPLAAGGLVALHQQARLAAHLSVEILHPELLAPLGPGLELRPRGDETVVGQHADGEGQILQKLNEAPFPGRGDQNIADPVFCGAAQELRINPLRIIL